MAIIYKIHYDNVGKAYIGSSVPADPNYWGSMSPMGLARMQEDHARAGLPIVRRREILWEGDRDDTLTKREYALITAHRTNIPAYGYNLMPMLEGVNIPKKITWDPPNGGDIQRSTNWPHGVYTIHLRGERPYWSTFTDLDGDVIELYRGKSRDDAWHRYIAHKNETAEQAAMEPGDIPS
ncbi:MAG: hypothetical protein WCE30_03420 [Mycobacterium sp.]